MDTETMQGKSRVCVVGGGIAGASLVKSLQYAADVVLIDSKEYIEIPWAQLRSMVEPSFAERSIIQHTDYLKNGKLIVSSAVNVTATGVLTADGSCVPYDYLVVATGHTDSVPLSRSLRIQQFKADNEKIQSSDSILIVGGGPTGVELAGEIAVDFPEKKVTLVHSGSRLMEFIGPKASAKTLDWLVSKKVEKVDLHSITEGEKKAYNLSGGETIAADCHFLCVAKPCGSSWLKDSVLKDSLDVQGRLKVDENLRVIGQKNIFAIGDITNVPEMKQGYLAERHAEVAAKNIKHLIRVGKEEKLAMYKPGSAMAIVSLGRKEGVAQFPFVTLIGWLPGRIKSKDLFVGKTRKHLGLSPH
ncbi:apoptosis-inducing factor B [Cinnamomum micranthum f. kanehirae]|uniref:Apoptosis-inducing factor B n=1 Tax=Cinnamomum micranthum f. kanehirae TaxID=337451 RepID=A0A443P396_9MAGN|nr:apoptosis-inducing factor B [Cinnamomum micranthum f. kanehirae]